MRGYRRKRLRYGLMSGIVAFAAGWAVATFLAPSGIFTDHPRWQGTLWVYLGTHFVELSSVHTGGIGIDSTQPLEMVDLPQTIRYVPVVVVAGASLYTCNEISTIKIKHNISNAIGAGTGYFLVGIIAMIGSNMQPSLSTILLIGGGVAAAVWVGSTFVGAATRGLPVFGVASLGTIAGLGIFLILGGIAILNVIWGLVAFSFGVAAVTGGVVGVERGLKRRGRRQNTDYPRLAGLQLFVEDKWKELIVTAAVLVTLYFGLTG